MLGKIRSYSLVVVILTLSAIPSFSGVTINEFCYHADPSGDTGKEWIEFYNSDSTEQDLSGWDLYPSRTPHFIFPTGTRIAPQSFLLLYLRRDGINTATEIYEGIGDITSNMTNTKGSVALFTSSNKDTIMDFVQYGDDSLTYEATAAGAGIWTRGVYLDTAFCGNSLGLIADGLDSNRKSDWKEFLRPTPGHTNQPYPVDIEVSVPVVSPETVLPERTFAFSAEIVNMGLDTAFSPVIEMFEDVDGDSIRDAGERLYALLSWDFLCDKRTALAQIPELVEGQYIMAVSARCSSENFTANNYRSLIVTVGNPVVINEFMYYPNSGAAEWIELYNRSGKAVDIKGWSVDDISGEPRTITYATQLIPPNNFVILTSSQTQPIAGCFRLVPDGGLPSLNDDGDVIRLRDARRVQTEMVQYSSDWGKGRAISLEKVNPFLASNAAASWGLSNDSYGSTPGKRNSIYAENTASAATISAGPNPFSPDNDGRDDRTILNYKLPWDDALVNISVFDRLGRRVRTLLSNCRSAREGSYAWDGKNGDGRKCPMGNYIILLEAGEYSGSGSMQAKATVVVAGKL
jgi:hypothetical protein